jgi:hypothetical protein
MSDSPVPEALTFDADIKPLFRAQDRNAMSFAFDLWAYADVVANAEGILARVADGTMPCDGGWPPETVAVFRHWVDSGMPQ